MHVEAPGDVAQGQRPQAVDALFEKFPLRAHQFPGHREERRGPLLQRADEPAGGAEILADPGAVAPAAAGQGAVAPVDRELRRRCRVEGHGPAAARPPRMDIGRHRLRRSGFERRAGLRVQGADPAHPLPHPLPVDAAARRQGVQIAPGDQVEIVEQALHRRVELAAFGELQGQTFAQIARAHPHRFAGVQTRQSALDTGRGTAQATGDAPRVAGEIPRFVERVDEPGADEAFAGVGHVEPDLLLEMAPQARRGGNGGAGPVRGVGAAIRGPDGRRVVETRSAGRVGAVPPDALEERVALELALDQSLQFDAGQPQQFYRLLQPGGHDHPLAEALRQPELPGHDGGF